MGEAAKPLLFESFQAGCHVEQHFGDKLFIPHSTLYTLNSPLYMSLENRFVISWRAQHFGHVQLHFAWQAQHFRRHFTARGVHVVFHIALFRLNVSHVHFGSWRFCLVSSLWFSCGVAVSMREVTKSLLFECFQAGCHVVLRGWHSTL